LQVEPGGWLLRIKDIEVAAGTIIGTPPIELTQSTARTNSFGHLSPARPNKISRISVEKGPDLSNYRE
jgi:hypothetical protein